MEAFSVSTSLTSFFPPFLLPKALTLNIHLTIVLDIFRTVDFIDCFLSMTLFTSLVISLKAKETEKFSCEIIINLVLSRTCKMFMLELLLS